MAANSPCGGKKGAGKSAARWLASITLSTLILFSPGSASYARGDGAARIRDFDLLRNLAIEKRKHGPGGQPSSQFTTTVSFDIQGREIVLDLDRNDRLVAKLRSRLRLDDGDLTIFKGAIRAVPGSWARISIDDGQISGVVWDGTELLLIDRVDRLEGLSGVTKQGDRTAVVRLADIELPVDSGTHPNMAGETSSADILLAHTVAAAKGFEASADLAFGAISLGIVIGDGVDGSIRDVVQAAIEWANISDGIFSEQVDVHLDLEHIENLTGRFDLFSSSDPSALLSELSAYKVSNANLAQLGLAHLLTRNDLNGLTRGFASIRSACAPHAGVGLTEIRGGVLDALIMTHELGHNLGAPHDNESGSVCATTPDGYLMSPVINGSSIFSPCSITQMTAFLDDLACLVAIAGSEIELERPMVDEPVYYKDRIPVTVNVNNTGLESIVDSRLDMTGSDFGMIVLRATDRDCTQQTWSPAQVCDLDNLYAGETITIYTEISPRATGLQVLNFTVSGANDTDPTNNTHSFELDVQPATEAYVSGVNLTSFKTWQGGSVTYSVVATNGGDFDTTAVVYLWFDPVHTLSSTIPCASRTPGGLECDVGLLEAGGGSASFDIELQISPDLGLGLAEEWVDSVVLELTTSIHNTVDMAIGGLAFAIYGAVHDPDTGFVEAPEIIDSGTSGEFVAFLTNHGPDPVPDLAFQIQRSVGLEIELTANSRGNCTPNGEGVRCEMGQFDAGEYAEFSVAYSAANAGSYQVSLMGIPTGGLILSGRFPTAVADVVVASTAPPTTPPTSPSPSTPRPKRGGGGTSQLWLLLMATIVLARSVPATRSASI